MVFKQYFFQVFAFLLSILSNTFEIYKEILHKVKRTL